MYLEVSLEHTLFHTSNPGMRAGVGNAPQAQRKENSDTRRMMMMLVLCCTLFAKS